MKKVAIIGAGTAGLTVAARLMNSSEKLEVIVVDPATKHYYQPLWTLVGGGVGTKEETGRDMASVIPGGVTWIQDSVTTIDPENNQVSLANRPEALSYDYLVACPGIQIDWDKVEGLRENLGKNGVCSNYSYDHVQYTWECLQNVSEGNALFTFPSTPIKCGGAPQKIMYLADSALRKRGVRNKMKVEFVSAGGGIFGVEKYKKALQKVVDRKEIDTTYQHDLVKIDGEKKIATFKNMETGELMEKEFSMIHVGPHQSAPEFIKQSPLANGEGWLDTNQYTLQHNKFENVFCLGDASSCPTAKTGAAIRKQAPVLVANMLNHMHRHPATAKYNGYSSCPLVTDYGKLILAEFDYDSQPAETFPFNQAKERASMYFMKKYILPVLYWQGMLKGRA